MQLSRKFDLYNLIITVVFIVIFLLSYYTINTISTKTANLLDVSRELDYLRTLKTSLTDLEHSIEHYLHILPGKGYSDSVKSDLMQYENALNNFRKIEFAEEEKQTIKFGIDNFEKFSLVISGLIENENKISRQDIEIYQKWRNDYIRKILLDIDKHWQENLEKVDKFSIRAVTAKEKAVQILVAIAVAMLFMLILSRFVVVRDIVRPIKTIEKVSDAIAKGDTGKRIDLKSKDELGSLSTSINMMAEAIEEKINKLKNLITKEQNAVREQTILNELMAFIASGVDLELSLRTFLGRTRDLMKAEHSAIFILENKEDTKEPELQIFLNTFEEKTSTDCAIAMLKGVFKYTLNTFEAIRKNTVMGEVPATHFAVKNLIAIPLSSIDKKISGLIVLVNKDGGFTDEDEDVLFNFSFQAFQAITLQQEIFRYATTDGLTGLNNHRVFKEKLEEEMERSKRYSRDVSLLMIDIDHFKSFNDIYGHQAGDYVLKNVAKLIHKGIRTTDFGARYGGEEFAAILPETAGPQAFTVAERMRNSISTHEFVLEKGDTCSVTISIGYAAYPEDADSSELLIKKADQGLYFAKENGRNRVCRYYDTHGKAEGRIPEEIKNILHDTSLTSVKELAKAIDSKSNYMRGHSFEVAAISVMIGKNLGLSEEQVEGLRIASLLHDVGNLGIPDNILNKPGPLTDEEKIIIQGHPGLSEMVLKHYPRSEHVLPAILYHHERFDGKGYPNGLKEEEIPLPAKILGVVEAYHAMTSPRPYRRRKTRLEALTEMERESGKQFDPLIVKTLINILKKIEDPLEKRSEKEN